MNATSFRFAIGLGLLVVLFLGAKPALQAEISADVRIYVSGHMPEEQLESEEDFKEAYGTFLDGYHFASWTGHSGIDTCDFRARVLPCRSYTVNVTMGGYSAFTVHIGAAPGYRVIMDNIVRKSVYVDWQGGQVTFMLVPLGSEMPQLAGFASSFSHTGVRWSVPLGTTRDGKSAGNLYLSDIGLDSNWATMGTPGRLSCEAASDEVKVHQVNGAIRQVASNQVVLDVVTLTATSYEIRCYSRMQAWSAYWSVQTPTGSPFATYLIDASVNGALWITKTTRTIPDYTTTGVAAARVEWTVLNRFGSWPTHCWVRDDWRVRPSSVDYSITSVQSGGTTAARTESLTISPSRTPSSSQIAVNLSRTYAALNFGEALTGETLGTTNPVSAAFTYYQDSNEPNSYGQLKTVELTGGRWESYEYYPDSAAERTPGLLKYRFRPYSESPASPGASTPAFNPAQGEVTYYEYFGATFGLWDERRPTLIRTSINGVVTAKKTISYDDPLSGTDYRETLVLSVTENEFTDANNYNYVTVDRKVYGHRVSPSMYQDQPRATCYPDGRKDLHILEWGNYASNSSTGVRGVIRGRRSASAGTYAYMQRNFFSDPWETIYLCEGESTFEKEILDARALVTRQERHVWLNGDWRLIYSKDFTITPSGITSGYVASDGTAESSTIVGLLKTSETDAAGTKKFYVHDEAGRVKDIVHESSASIAARTTRYTYDVVGNVVSETVDPTGAAPIVSRKTYDDANRLGTETPPGGYGVVTHSYNPASRTHTITRGAVATVETKYLDGRLYSKTGAGTVAEYHTYGRETDGRTWERVDLATTSSARWRQSWANWRGSGIRTERPGFGGAASVLEESFFNSAGQLYRSTKPGPTSVSLIARSQFDAVGRPFLSGLDIGDNGLVKTSTDRLMETAELFELSGGDYWTRKTTYAYPTPNSATAVVTGIERRRLTGHPTGRVDEVQTTDADGNVTTITKDVNRTTKIVTVTTTRPGLANPQTEKIENGLSVAVTSHDGLVTTTLYDALHRPWKKVGSRNGNTIETTYIPGTRLIETVKEKANTGSPVTVATSTYDPLGRKSSEKNSDNKLTYFAYNSRDQLIKQWGGATYPVAYAYSSFGEKIAMRTFRSPTQDFTAAAWPLSDDGSDPNNPDPASWTTGDITRWVYDPGTGLLAEKQFARLQPTDPLKTTKYTYNPAGQLATREWARTVAAGPSAGQRVKATYSYDPATGDQTGITYNDGTPAIAYGYTRLGQVDTVQDFTSASGADLRDFGYDISYPHRLGAEVMTSFYGARAMTRLYESSGVLGRVRGFKLGSAVNNNGELEQTYGYATNGRLETLSTLSPQLSATSRTFRYGYLPNSALLESLAIDQGAGPGGHPFTITRTYEPNRDVLETIETKWGSSPGNTRTKFAYHVNNLGQRDSVEQSGDVFTGYGGSNNEQPHPPDLWLQRPRRSHRRPDEARRRGRRRLRAHEPPARVRLRPHRQPQLGRRHRQHGRPQDLHAEMR